MNFEYVPSVWDLIWGSFPKEGNEHNAIIVRVIDGEVYLLLLLQVKDFISE